MKPFHMLLALIMMITGSINTITTKFADIQCAVGVPNYRSGLQNSSKTSFKVAKNANPCVQWMDRTSCNKHTSDNCQWVQYKGDQPTPGPNETVYDEDGATGWCDNTDCLIAEVISGKGPDGKPCGENCGVEHTNAHLFDHPFVQSLTMFIGEFACLFAFHLIMFINKARGRAPEPEKVVAAADEVQPPAWCFKRDSPFSFMVFALPALCDSVATTTMYIGLTMTYASSFQMLRGAVVIFTGILSKFAGEDLGWTHVCGMVVVLFGLISVGGAAFIKDGGNATGAVENMPHEITGDMLIIAAQVVVAFQMVIEGKLMQWYKVQPLQLVGYEGFFGCLYMTMFCVLFYGQAGPRGGKFEHAYDAIQQLKNSANIQLALIGTVFSIAIFNWSGVSITKHMSATTRMVIDSLRTIIIWGLGLLFKDAHTVGKDASGKSKPHWEHFDVAGPGWLQILGFVLLLGGSATFNQRVVYGDVKEPLIYPLLRKIPGVAGCFPEKRPGLERSPLIGGKGSVNYANA